MGTHDVEQLEGYLEEFRSIVDRLTVGADWDQLPPQWRKPGWTTPAEFQLVAGVLESMVQQAETLERCKEVVISGSKAITTAAEKVGEPAGAY